MVAMSHCFNASMRPRLRLFTSSFLVVLISTKKTPGGSSRATPGWNTGLGEVLARVGSLRRRDGRGVRLHVVVFDDEDVPGDVSGGGRAGGRVGVEHEEVTVSRRAARRLIDAVAAGRAADSRVADEHGANGAVKGSGGREVPHEAGRPVEVPHDHEGIHDAAARRELVEN